MSQEILRPIPSHTWYSLQLIKQHYLNCVTDYEAKILEYQQLTARAKTQLGHVQSLMDELEDTNGLAAALVTRHIEKELSGK